MTLLTAPVLFAAWKDMALLLPVPSAAAPVITSLEPASGSAGGGATCVQRFGVDGAELRIGMAKPRDKRGPKCCKSDPKATNPNMQKHIFLCKMV